MDDTGMISFGKAIRNAFARMGDTDHVAAAPGDFVDGEGYLCCGACGKHKEFRRKFDFMEHMFVVPCLCDCGRAELARREREAQLKREREKVSELFQFSLVDERFREARFENLTATPDNARAIRIARNYVEHFQEMYAMAKGLILYGPTGTGKTYLADCIANALMERGVPVLVTSIVALTRGMGEELPMVLQKMKSARLLVLDDFGAERFTDFKAEQIFDVIDARYSSKKPMIITTNFPLSELKKGEDIRRQRVNERILEVCHPVKMDGESWRRKKVRENYSSIAALLEEEPGGLNRGAREPGEGA